jgi:hypothetical protein
MKRQKKTKKNKKPTKKEQKTFFCPFQQRGICKKLRIPQTLSKKLKAASRQTK